MRKIELDLNHGGYPIFIGRGILADLPEFMNGIPPSSRHLLISDASVYALYGAMLLKTLRQAGYDIQTAIIPGGEEHKNLQTMAYLYEQMILSGLDRTSCVLALGGGIVGDTAGFAAASYMRGIPCIQIPTTLLAQVDSSIGGKTGVNLPQGKNLVGAFHQPLLVYSDIDLLDSLPEKEYCNGLAEVIKYGLLNAKLWTMLEEKHGSIQKRNPACLQDIIARCSEIKARIVSTDEREQGQRALLNLGHTFGHAIENLTGYQHYTHGEAVAIGIVYAARTACLLEMISHQDLDRIRQLITAYKLPVDCSQLSPQAILEQMYRDKKATSGTLRIVLPQAIGSCIIREDVPDSLLLKALSG